MDPPPPRRRPRWPSWRLAGPLFTIAVLLWLFLQAGVREIKPRSDRPPLPLAQFKPGPADWPGWRGPSQQGLADESADPPWRWSPTSSAGWQTVLPGGGQSSPCVWGDAVYLTAALSASKTVALLRFDRDSGRLVWHRDVGPLSGPPAEAALPTPACDGSLIFVPVVREGYVHLVAIDAEGKLRWTCPTGPYSGRQGFHGSPVVHGSLVYLAVDEPGTRLTRWRSASTLSAVHRQTGELVWRVVRPCAESAGVPVAALLAGRRQVVFPGRRQIASYDADTGRLLWFCRWSSARVTGSVAFDGLHVYASAGEAEAETLCVRADGTGDVTDSHVVWRERRFTAEGAWPTLAGSSLVLLGRQGSVTALEKSTGRWLWQRRLTGEFEAPPVLVRQRLYCTSREGITYVVDTARRGEVLAENGLGQAVTAALAVSGNHLIVRGARSLQLITSPPAGPYAAEPVPVPRKL